MGALVEQVANALCEADGITFGEKSSYWREVARTAIEAMREPTETMANAGDDCAEHDGEPIAEIWQAMIDEGLK